MKKTEILRAFEELDRVLGRKGVRGEIGVVGGAAMVLAFNARSATKDVDAIFKPSSELRDAAKEVAAEIGLPEDWINDAVKLYLPGNPKKKTIVFDKDHLKVWIPEPEYLLAMKGLSARFDTQDKNDLQILIKILRLKDAKEVLDIVQKYYPKQRIPAKTQFFVEELFE